MRIEMQLLKIAEIHASKWHFESFSDNSVSVSIWNGMNGTVNTIIIDKINCT